MARSMLAEAGYRVRECPEVKFRAPVAPAVAIDFRIEVASERVARFVAQTGGTTAMTGTFICDKAALQS
jgi:3-hydroxymyristoyl/3-hydroxydecanoyl-(acyl carrier protein) dehydratase